MKKLFILICAAAFLGLNACNEDSDIQTAIPPEDGQTNPPAECPNACKGDDVCEGTKSYKTCKDDDGDGCKEWVTVTCDNGQKCDAGVCVPADTSCQSTCEGDDYCDGDNAFKTCKDDNNDGCNEWVTVTCDEGKKCQNGACVPTDASCQNTCEGENYCDGDNAFKTCKDDDNDGCKEWVTVTCDEGKKCDGGKCVDGNPCTSLCKKGEKQCNDKSVQTCDDYNSDGCFEWGGDSPCSYQCNEGSCVEDPNAIPTCSGDDCPEVVTDFSKTISGNTQEGTTKFSSYSCDTSVSEAGPERSYVFKVNEPGTIIAGVTEPSGGRDVDVHILSALDANSCLDRGDKGANAHVDAGIYYVVVDTFETSDNAGPFNLKITFLPDSGKCGLAQTSIDHVKIGNMHLPITGKVVKEAHMVTDEDWKELGRWPNTIHEYITQHRARSAAWTGINEGDEWCPAGEGDCEYGQGATGNPVPWKAEAWYVCMYWTGSTKPTPGTRFLVVNPQTGKAVVTAAGYETGPGDEGTIGGAVYEIHHTLGTDHKSTLTFGQMKDQSLEYGPIDCN